MNREMAFRTRNCERAFVPIDPPFATFQLVPGLSGYQNEAAEPVGAAASSGGRRESRLKPFESGSLRWARMCVHALAHVGHTLRNMYLCSCLGLCVQLPVSRWKCRPGGKSHFNGLAILGHFFLCFSMFSLKLIFNTRWNTVVEWKRKCAWVCFWPNKISARFRLSRMSMQYLVSWN